MKRSGLWMVVFSVVIFSIITIVTGLASAQDQSSSSPAGAGKARCQGRFDTMDANHDGVVTKDEFMSGRHRAGAAREERFNAKDANGDGTLTKDEFCTAPKMSCQDRFSKLDTDHDGVLTKDEFTAARHRGGASAPEGVFTSRDTDGNSTLTQDEFCARKRGGKPKAQ